MEIQQRIYNANRAKEILDNEVFQQVMDDLQTEIIEQWKNSPARDEEGRQNLWSLLKLSQKFQLILKSSLETGQLAELELKHKQNVLDRAKSMMRL
jgi:hypothetical protein